MSFEVKKKSIMDLYYLFFSRGGSWDDNAGVYRITRSFYDSCTLSDREKICGRKRKRWDSFKSDACEYLSGLGFQVAYGKGQGGSLEISGFSPGYDFGNAYAEHLFFIGCHEGDVCSLLYSHLDEFGDEVFEEFEIGADFRKGFCDFVSDDSKGFSFSKGRSAKCFSIRQRSISFYGSEGELQEIINGLPSLKEVISPSYSSFTRHIVNKGIEKGPLKNADILGVSIFRGYSGDSERSHAIEVKKDNSVESVIKALNQASSYKEFSDYVWLAIPGMSSEKFPDARRYVEFMEIVEREGFGVIDIKLSGSLDNVSSVVVKKSARRLPRNSDIFSTEVIAKVGLDYCRRCGAFYDVSSESDGEKSIAPEGCAWRVDDQCYRAMEEAALKKVIGNE